MPDAPAPKKKSFRKPTEENLVLDLLALSGQHGEAARKTLEKIANRAWAKTFVPEEDWDRMVFFDDADDYRGTHAGRSRLLRQEFLTLYTEILPNKMKSLDA